jgi:type I restriction enzyme S subunit
MDKVKVFNWEECKLDDICVRIVDGSHNPPKSQSSGYSMLSAKDVFDNKIDFSSPRYLDEAAFIEENKRTDIQPGDILLTIVATIGRTTVVPKNAPKFTLQRSVAVIKSLVNSEYLCYYFQSQFFQNKLREHAKGTAQKGVYLKTLSNLTVNIAPLNEQNRIVLKLDELLSELEKGKEQLKTSMEQLKVYRQSILKHAFEGKLSERWRSKQKKLKRPDELMAEIRVYRKLQYEKHLKEYKSGKAKIKPKEPKEISSPEKSEISNKSELPNGWFYIYLKDISDLVERINLKEKKATESFLYLDIGGINNNKNIIESHKEYKWKDAPSRAQQVVKPNDILFSTVRTYMKNIAMIVDDKFTNQVASSGFTIVRALAGIINPYFLFKYLLSDTFIQPLNELQTGSSYPAVRDTDVFNQIIPICSFEEQLVIMQELDEKYSIIQNLEDTINKNLIQSNALRQTLLQKAFKGKLVAQDPIDEPAFVLLDRIKKEREEFLKAEKEKRKNLKKPMKKKSAAKVFEFPLLETIKEKFGSKLFTFDQLKSEVEINYDDLKEGLFSLLDNEKGLKMEFDQKKESMIFKYVGK